MVLDIGVHNRFEMFKLTVVQQTEYVSLEQGKTIKSIEEKGEREMSM
jgi:hypothetical protein